MFQYCLTVFAWANCIWGLNFKFIHLVIESLLQRTLWCTDGFEFLSTSHRYRFDDILLSQKLQDSSRYHHTSNVKWYCPWWLSNQDVKWLGDLGVLECREIRFWWDSKYLAYFLVVEMVINKGIIHLVLSWLFPKN